MRAVARRDGHTGRVSESGWTPERAPDSWPAGSRPSEPALPRVEDLPIVDHGYDPERVQEAFDSFYRHAAQLDASLRVLEAVDAFRRHATDLRSDIRALRAASWAPQPVQQQVWHDPYSASRGARPLAPAMPSALPRLALEAAFIILVAVGAGLAELTTLMTVAVVGAAWLIVGLVELVAAQTRSGALPTARPYPSPVLEPLSDGAVAAREAEPPARLEEATMIGAPPAEEAVEREEELEPPAAEPEAEAKPDAEAAVETEAEVEAEAEAEPAPEAAEERVFVVAEAVPRIEPAAEPAPDEAVEEQVEAAPAEAEPVPVEDERDLEEEPVPALAEAERGPEPVEAPPEEEPVAALAAAAPEPFAREVMPEPESALEEEPMPALAEAEAEAQRVPDAMEAAFEEEAAPSLAQAELAPVADAPEREPEPEPYVPWTEDAPAPVDDEVEPALVAEQAPAVEEEPVAASAEAERVPEPEHAEVPADAMPEEEPVADAAADEEPAPAGGPPLADAAAADAPEPEIEPEPQRRSFWRRRRAVALPPLEAESQAPRFRILRPDADAEERRDPWEQTGKIAPGVADAAARAEETVPETEVEPAPATAEGEVDPAVADAAAGDERAPAEVAAFAPPAETDDDAAQLSADVAADPEAAVEPIAQRDQDAVVGADHEQPPADEPPRRRRFWMRRHDDVHPTPEADLSPEIDAAVEAASAAGAPETTLETERDDAVEAEPGADAAPELAVEDEPEPAFTEQEPPRRRRFWMPRHEDERAAIEPRHSPDADAGIAEAERASETVPETKRGEAIPPELAADTESEAAVEEDPEPVVADQEPLPTPEPAGGHVSALETVSMPESGADAEPQFELAAEQPDAAAIAEEAEPEPVPIAEDRPPRRSFWRRRRDEAAPGEEERPRETLVPAVEPEQVSTPWDVAPDARVDPWEQAPFGAPAEGASSAPDTLGEPVSDERTSDEPVARIPAGVAPRRRRGRR